MNFWIADTTHDRLWNDKTRPLGKIWGDRRAFKLGYCDPMFQISLQNFLKFVAPVLGTIVLAAAGWWANWLSTEVIGIGREISSLTEKFENLDDKVSRIQHHLPVQIYAHADDLYSQEFKTAIISGESFEENGQIVKAVTLFDAVDRKIKIYKFPVNNDWDTEWLSSALWEIANNDINSFEFDYLESYRKGLDSEAGGKILVEPMPKFVDTKHSILSSKDFSNLVKIMDSIVDIRGKVSSVEHDIDIVKGSNNYRSLPSIIKKIEASYIIVD